MLETRKSITLTGTSTVEVMTNEGTQTVPVAYMSASIPDGGTQPNVTKTLQDRELYIANKEQVKADMDEFEDMAWELVQ